MSINKIKFLIFLCISFCIFLGINTVYGQKTLIDTKIKLFEDANNYYNQQHYNLAVLGYNRLINNGISNSILYYNLANAYYKNHQIAKALVNYDNALILQPRNPQIQANFRFVSDQVRDNISSEESLQPVIELLLFWYFQLNLFELLLLSVAFTMILSSLLLISVYIKNDNFRLAKHIVFFITCVLIISSVIKLYNNFNSTEGFIGKDKSEIKSGNGSEFKTLFFLNEGIAFTILEKRGEWLKIILQDGRKGWINRKFTELVSASM